MILTGGVSISDKEIEYVNDALKNGWDENHDSYIKKFEEAFADYVGVKYARSLSGGTQALTLACATLDIGPGDEVIIPDLTYFACSDVVKLLGAEPIFSDVLPDTWCIDPEKLEKEITPDTKAIMPVWAYGNAPEMKEIKRIAKEREIYVIEDACPAVGTTYRGKMAGSFGDFGCFSFHGAKIMTTGFGGMLVTNNKKLYEKMMWLSDHGEDKNRKDRFWQTGVGYSFDLPNINCALGLAQLERINEFVEKKRLINSWYREHLKGLVLFNTEQPYVRNNCWLTSIILEGFDRKKFMDNLRSRGIDTRPFFYPISMFEMYEYQDTPVAHYDGLHGVNLPSGVKRTYGEIEHICDAIKEILNEG